MSKEILCTLGPASMNDRVIARLEELGVSLFRINLSHTKIEDVAPVIDFVQARTKVPLCLDTEGAQIRTGAIAEGQAIVRDNSVIRVYRAPVPGDSQRLNLYPPDIVDCLELGDFVCIDFNTVLAQVIEREPGNVTLRVVNGGTFGANKAVTVERAIAMPPLTEKDSAAMAIGREKGIRHVALSFANRGADLDVIRAAALPDAFVISKIECRNGLINLDEIIAKSDALLIDRGDLSREMPIERVPALQKWVTRRGKQAGRKVYVATNLLESMITAPVPTRAEVNDVFNTLLDGVDGLVLAAETAIGANPIGCAKMIVTLIKDFENDAELDPARIGQYGSGDSPLLIAPHGGTLISRQTAALPATELSAMARIAVGEKVMMDCDQIAVGTFSPLEGFMDRETLKSVLAEHRLPNGVAWTMPIVLQLDDAAVAGIGVGDRVALGTATELAAASLEVTEIFRFDLESLAERWYGTRSIEHPGVAELLRGGGNFVAGPIAQYARHPSPHRHYELTPLQARYVFAYKGWSRIVGFHTRNVAHRAHEHMILSALESTGADGVLISPVIGPKKSGDFLPESILKSYQMMLDLGLFPPGKAILGSLATYPRYAGPREAVFTAICRKNMGCSHFIVGRDHAGVGGFYTADATRELFDRLEDLEITPQFFDVIGYDLSNQRYTAVGESTHLEMISGTELRDALKENRRLPEWFARQIIQDTLQADIAAGRPVFCD